MMEKNTIFTNIEFKKQQELVKSFIQFLKERGALKKFIYNLNFMRKYNPNDSNYDKRFFSIEGFKDLPHNMEHMIVHSFCWFTTKEGDEYWRKISMDWYSFILDKIAREHIR